MRTLGDRRASVRLDILGALWGMLELAEPTRLINISQSGALIASSVPLPRGSVQPLQVTVQGSDIVVEARVRHLRVVSAPGEPVVYLIGLEFVAALDSLGSMAV